MVVTARTKEMVLQTIKSGSQSTKSIMENTGLSFENVAEAFSQLHSEGKLKNIIPSGGLPYQTQQEIDSSVKTSLKNLSSEGGSTPATPENITTKALMKDTGLGFDKVAESVSRLNESGELNKYTQADTIKKDKPANQIAPVTNTEKEKVLTALESGSQSTKSLIDNTGMPFERVAKTYSELSTEGKVAKYIPTGNLPYRTNKEIDSTVKTALRNISGYGGSILSKDNVTTKALMQETGLDFVKLAESVSRLYDQGELGKYIPASGIKYDKNDAVVKEALSNLSNADSSYPTPENVTVEALMDATGLDVIELAQSINNINAQGELTKYVPSGEIKYDVRTIDATFSVNPQKYNISRYNISGGNRKSDKVKKSYDMVSM